MAASSGPLISLLSALVTALLGAAPLLSGSPPSSPPPDPVTECERARLWVGEHLHALPDSRAELAEYSPVYRRAIVAEYPPTTRQRLWREHLHAFRTSYSGLSERQIRFIGQLVERLDVLLDPAAEPRDGVRQMKRKAAGLFPPRLRHKIFAQPLPPSIQLFHRAGSGTAWHPAMASTIGAPSGSRTLCDCAIGSSFSCNSITGPSTQCVSGACTATSGCGFLWMDQCNGICQVTGGGGGSEEGGGGSGGDDGGDELQDDGDCQWGDDYIGWGDCDEPHL